MFGQRPQFPSGSCGRFLFDASDAGASLVECAMETAWQWLTAHPLILTLLIMQVADIAMGVCLACGSGQLASSISHRGMMRKAGTLIVTGIAYLLQRHMPDFPSGHLTATAFIATEGISILENAALLGIPIPAPLARALEKMQEEPETPKRESRRRVTVKTDSVIVTGRDTNPSFNTIRDE